MRIRELEDALMGFKQRELSGRLCFCVISGAELPDSYYENPGAATGHDNGFRHSNECLEARAALSH